MTRSCPGQLIGVNLHPVHVDPIEREQLLDALPEVVEDRVVRLLHLGVALMLSWISCCVSTSRPPTSV